MRILVSLAALILVLAVAALNPPLAIGLFLLAAVLSPVTRQLLAVNPALASNYVDAPSGTTLVFGGQSITIPTAAGNASPIVYDTEGFSLTVDSDFLVQNNSAARPNKQRGIPKVPETEIELSYPAASTANPYLFAEFAATGPNGTAYTFIVQRIVSSSKNDGSASKITIAARWKLN